MRLAASWRRGRRLLIACLGTILGVFPASAADTEEWDVGEWSLCSPTGALFDGDGNPTPPSCTGGEQHRTVECPGGNDAACDGPRPYSTRFCVLGNRCGWIITGWSACPVTECGAFGKRTRQRRCVSELPGACPEFDLLLTEACVGSADCSFWKSDWTECTASCGIGTQERIVRCQDPDGCGAQTPPASTQGCDAGACPWEPADWGPCSGACEQEGIQERRIYCGHAQGLCAGEQPETQQSCMGGCGENAASATGNSPADWAKMSALDVATPGASGPLEEIHEPSTVLKSTTVPPYTWFLGPWSECAGSCGYDVRTRIRDVYCSRTCSIWRCPEGPPIRCEEVEPKPREVEACDNNIPVYTMCTEDATVLSGWLMMSVTYAASFVSDRSSADAVRMALVFLLQHHRVALSMTAVQLTVARDRRLRGQGPQRRLNREDVRAEFSLTLPGGTPLDAVSEITFRLHNPSMAATQAAIEYGLRSYAGLAVFRIEVKSYDIADELSDGVPTTTSVVPSTEKQQVSATGDADEMLDHAGNFECIIGVRKTGCITGGETLRGCGPDCPCCRVKDGVGVVNVELLTEPKLQPDVPDATDIESIDWSPLAVLKRFALAIAALAMCFLCVVSVLIYCIWVKCIRVLLFGKRHKLSKTVPEDGLPMKRSSSYRKSKKKEVPWEHHEGAPTVSGWDEPAPPDADAPTKKSSRRSGKHSSRKSGRHHHSDGEGFNDGGSWYWHQTGEDEAEPRLFDPSKTWYAGMAEDFHHRGSSKGGKSRTRWNSGRRPPDLDTAFEDPTASHDSTTPMSRSRSRRSGKRSPKHSSRGLREDSPLPGAVHSPRHEAERQDSEGVRSPSGKKGSKTPSTPETRSSSHRASGSPSEESGSATPKSKDKDKAKAKETDKPKAKEAEREETPKKAEKPASPEGGRTSSHQGSNSQETGNKEASPKPPPPSTPAAASPPSEEALQALEITAAIDAKLDLTQGKELEWRRKHFKELLLEWHPDKNLERTAVATEVFRHLMKRRAGYLAA
eukprot:TRINITY_DN46492_c0_g1_i1.p1 TRINITY_DN46492_c0_g1~~TRINITY_DN46492_c0_g1_i1.p1  ORF type:complete len:1021 (-),score=169.02 TRINITY_DN46492_c0_g1_i1:104-3166(-)